MFSSQHRKTIVWGPDQVPLQNTGYCFITFLSTLLLFTQCQPMRCLILPKLTKGNRACWLFTSLRSVLAAWPRCSRNNSPSSPRALNWGTHQAHPSALWGKFLSWQPKYISLKSDNIRCTNRPWLEMTSVDRVKSRHKVGIWVVFRFRPLAPVGLLHAETSAPAVTSWSFGEYL